MLLACRPPICVILLALDRVQPSVAIQRLGGGDLTIPSEQSGPTTSERYQLTISNKKQG
jgi:hypothetical protein